VVAQPPFNVGKIAHVCLVVEDIDKSVEAYHRELGLGPWRIVTYGSAECAQGGTYRGQPGHFRMRFAMTNVSGLVLELVQHLEGETIYQDFFEKSGEGIHHLGIDVPNLAEAVAQFEALGFKSIMTAHGFGKIHDGSFAYMGTEDELGTIYELVQPPTIRFDPDRFYPAQ
jgi:methylmalonyl-CoA/ethylmalonyl-CoA epimerase